MSDPTHNENIKKTRETVTPILDTKKLCVSKCSIETSLEQHKKYPEVGREVLLIQKILQKYYSNELS